jgi:hypothetical protein
MAVTGVPDEELLASLELFLRTMRSYDAGEVGEGSP